MKKIHSNIFNKKIRYDVSITIDASIKIDQLCEAHKISKNELSERIINELYYKSPKIKEYQDKIKRLKQKNSTMTLFDEVTND